MKELVSPKTLGSGLTESGERWEQLQREASWAAAEQYFLEYPEHRALDVVEDPKEYPLDFWKFPNAV